MERSDYDFITLSPEHELNEWLVERGYASQEDNRNRLAETVTHKLQDSLYVNVSRDAVNTRRGFQILSPGIRINRRIILPSGSVIACRDFVLFCFFLGLSFEFPKYSRITEMASSRLLKR